MSFSPMRAIGGQGSGRFEEVIWWYSSSPGLYGKEARP